MTSLRKYYIWLYMLTKRLLKRWSFLFLIFLIPIIALVTMSAMNGESGVLHIVLCNEGKEEIAENIIESIISRESVIRFSTSSSREDTEKMVINGNADAAWIFDDSFEKNLNKFTKGIKSTPPIKIIEREESIPLNISKEILFGAIYKETSYRLYRNYSEKNILANDTMSEKEIKSIYDSIENNNNVIEIEKLDAKTRKSNTNYLTTPIRGILSLLILLCALASSMFFLNDKSKGTYDWLPPKKQIWPSMASCLSASIISSIAVLIIIFLSGISLGTAYEIAAMFLYIIALTGFCTIFSLVFRSYGTLGALIPGILIVSLILSPIFFNFKILRPVRLILPTYYYLQSVYNAKYLVNTLFYIVGTYSVCFIINSFKKA